jgi:hypothetical protein
MRRKKLKKSLISNNIFFVSNCSIVDVKVLYFFTATNFDYFGADLKKL